MFASGVLGRGLISFCLTTSNTEQLSATSCTFSSAALTTLASASGVLGEGGGLVSICLTTSITQQSSATSCTLGSAALTTLASAGCWGGGGGGANFVLSDDVHCRAVQCY